MIPTICFAALILAASCENIQKNLEDRLNKTIDSQIDKIDSVIQNN